MSATIDQKVKHLEMMKEPKRWLHYPLLPLIKDVSRGEPQPPKIALLLDASGLSSNLLLLYEGANLFSNDLALRIPEELTAEQVFDRGWRVD